MSGAASVSIQQAIFTKLRADGPLGALLPTSLFTGDAGKAVYDRPPASNFSELASGVFPFVVIGDDTVAEFDDDDTEGQETTLTIHAWSRSPGKKEVKQVLDAIYNSLHDKALTVTGQMVIYILFEFMETMADPDGLTQHGVIRFRITTQET
jgi:uncharacterized protein (UPF0297 family)